MNAFRQIAFILVLFAGTTACTQEPEPIRLLRWVEKADPIADAKAAVERNHYVLIGVHGYSWTMPGVTKSKQFEYRDRYGVKLLEGTGDVILGEEHARLIGLALEYAEKYNLYILSHLNER